MPNILRDDTKVKPGTRCRQWQDRGVWQSLCGKVLQYDDIDIEPSSFTFCPFCGRRIVIEN